MPRSVVFITADSIPRQVCSPDGGLPGIETPGLAALAARGAWCERAYCATPLCTPARAAWYTGLHPTVAGAPCNNLRPRRDTPLLAELLGAAGYHCRHLGKWHLDGCGHEGGGHCQGGFVGAWYDQSTFMDEVGRDGPPPARFGNWNRGLEDANFCFGERLVTRSEDLLRSHDYAQPLFLAVEFDEPHGPYICPPPWRGRHAWAELPRPATLRDTLAGKPALHRDMAAFLRAGRDNAGADLARYYQHYYDCLAYADHCIARVAAAVRRYAPAETAIVVTADHGDHLGAFGLGPKGPTMYESCIGVPLILDVPGVTTPGQRYAAPVQGVDIFATLLDCASAWDADARPARPGDACRSLLPQLRGEEPERSTALISYERFGIGVAACAGYHPIRCITDGRRKLVVNLFDRDEYYDRVSDPDEADNRIDDPAIAAERDALHDQMLEAMQGSRDLLAGRAWRERPWRRAAAEPVTALFPTGYREAVASRPFA
ncbi:MAG: sulfatase-like hydrolase/transferase [Planctomycetota bacterium]|jgi:uncharacterized sulfatase|nr:sulfatase-like hydrolase/transferase [Planctomycetota bacterium]